MLVNPRRGNVLEVVVLCVISHALDPILRVFADTVGMTDVEVEPNPG